MWPSLRISRNFSITKALEVRSTRGKSNPGLGHQISALEDVPASMQDDPEGFGDMETDFSNVHQLHKSHEHERSEERDKMRLFVVKSKYFPSIKLPNFLTYAEKEQIRLLHNRDGEQWSVDVLAESFPANCEIIRKVLKANWKSSSLKRIQTHDQGVSKNWQLFLKGEFNNQLPKEMQEHLKKFSDRKNLAEQTDVPTRIDRSPPISNEFSSILAVGTKRTEAPKIAIDSSQQEMAKMTPQGLAHNEEESYLLEKVRDKKNIRFKELMETKLKSERELTTVCNSDSRYPTTAPIADTSSSLSFTQKFTLNEVVIGEDDKKRYEISSVKDRVYIPRKLRRNGATYRIDNCYYDDDGEFLYRVPGMTARTNKS